MNENLVLMSCCNTWYATVKDSMNHVCPIDDGLIEYFKKMHMTAQRAADAKRSYQNTDGRTPEHMVKGKHEAMINTRNEFNAMWATLTMEQLQSFGEWLKIND